MLAPWAGRTVAEYAWANPDVLDELRTAGDRDAFVRWVGNAHTRDRDAAAERGTAVHDAIELWLKGQEVEYTEEVGVYLLPLMAFLDAWQIQPLYQELIVASRQHRYAGKFDLIGVSPLLNCGRPFIADFKTSRSAHGEAALQMAAYAKAEFMNGPDGTEIPVPEVDAAFVFHVTPGETLCLPAAESIQEVDEHYGLFLDALAVYRGATARRKALKPALVLPESVAAAA